MKIPQWCSGPKERVNYSYIPIPFIQKNQPQNVMYQNGKGPSNPTT